MDIRGNRLATVLRQAMPTLPSRQACLKVPGSVLALTCLVAELVSVAFPDRPTFSLSGC